MKYPPEIQYILNDRISGSVGIVNKLLQTFELQLLNPNQKRDEFRRLVSSIRIELRHFAAVENLCRDILIRLEDPNPFPSVIGRYLSEYRAYWDQSIDHITNNIIKHSDLNSKAILIHSNSNTILSLIEKLKDLKYNFRVIQTLSVPGNEGRNSFRKLQGLNVEVILIEDSLIGRYINEIDFVFMGCDTLLEHEFLNKLGTLTIAKAAAEQNVPFILITESRKEIAAGQWKSKIKQNSLFEWIPLELVTAIIDEKFQL